MDSAKVSIIVPCYNQAVYLSEALDSVMAQTYQNWECVIVNDGSPDNTEEIAKKYLDKDRRFKYIRQENKGLSSARNAGIDRSDGEYILPLDADDLIGSTYLEKAVGHFEQAPETKLVYCKAEKFGLVNGPWELEEFDYDCFIWNNCIFCTAMYKRCDYNKTEGYNPNMAHGIEDWDFWLTLINREDIVYKIDEVLFYYRVKEKSMVTELDKRYREEMLIQICRNHVDIYAPFKDKVVIYNQDLSEIHLLRESLAKIRKSQAYRLGKFLLKPFFWFRKNSL